MGSVLLLHPQGQLSHTYSFRTSSTVLPRHHSPSAAIGEGQGQLFHSYDSRTSSLTCYRQLRAGVGFLGRRASLPQPITPYGKLGTESRSPMLRFLGRFISMPVNKVSSTALTRRASGSTSPDVGAGKREHQLHSQQQSIKGKESGHLSLTHATTNQTSEAFLFSLSHALRATPILSEHSQLYCAAQGKYRTLSPE